MGGNNFTVYKSSAGSGKTYTLVKEYLGILLQDPESYRHILAITFTNKAANEMKERVLKYLRALSDPVAHYDKTVEGQLLDKLMKATGLAEAEIRRRSTIALRMIMHQYGDFSISTIDSFFHRVVRTFAYDLKIPLSFQVVVEEMEVLEEVVRMLMDRIGADETLTRTLVRFILSKAEREETWDVEKDLTGFSRVLVRESSLPYLSRLMEIDPGMLEEARDSIWTIIRRYEDLLAGQAAALLALLSSRGLPAEALAGASKGLVPWLRKLASGTSPVPPVPASVASALQKNEWSSSKATKEDKAIIREMAPDLASAVGKLVTSSEQGNEQYQTFRILSGYVYELAVLGALETELQSYRKDNDVILISEFNRLIYSVVRDQPVPFVYERLGEKYRHFLVDEFQDTSVLQWHNLLPLLENSLAEGRFNMVVGDGKQAIYRFRSGDVRQFEMLPGVMNPHGDDLLNARQQALERNYFGDRLGTNFRSAGELVRFNVKFFKLAAGWISDEMKSVYSDVKQDVNSAAQGYIRLEFVDKTIKGGPRYADAMLGKILDTVNELQAAGVPEKDIAILCRDNTSASLTASWLLQNGKKVVSAESLLLSSSTKVNFLIAWLRTLANPSDEISRMQVLYRLLEEGKINGSEFNGLLLDPSRPDKRKEPDAFNAYTATRFFHFINSKYPGFSREMLIRKDLFHLVGELIRTFLDDRSPNPYVLTLQDIILEYTRNDYHSLEDFLEWWDEKGSARSIVTPEGLEAIRVMTIHKAKGLEFPVVILPFLHDSLRLTLDQAWVNVDDEELKNRMPFAYIDVSEALSGTAYRELYEEERDRSMVDMLNVLYVAMTRARNRMFIFSQSPPKSVEDAASLPKMFYHFLVHEGLWNEDRKAYTWGLEEPALRGEKATQPEAGETLRTGFPDWTRRVRLRTTAPEGWDVEDPEKAVSAGKKVHYILSEIRYAEDCEAAIHNGMAQGIISPDEFDHVHAMVLSLVNGPSTAFLFDHSWTVKNEAEIVDSRGKILRPDRLMFHDSEAVVVDFKTGMPSEHHFTQVNGYAALLRELGYTVNDAWIVYLGAEARLVQATGS